MIFAASFRLFDEDGNGELDRQEVERMLILVMKSMVRAPSFLIQLFPITSWCSRLPQLKKMSAPSEQVLKAREAEIQRIIDEIFAKVDADNVRTHFPFFCLAPVLRSHHLGRLTSCWTLHRAVR